MLSFCLPFYRNRSMLAHQYVLWASYPQALKNQIEIVLVDDGSPEPAVDVPRPDGLPALRIFRVLEDRLWHQHGARNLAATQANGPWLFLTDMDHELPADSLAHLLATLQGDVMFTFKRLDAPHLTPKLLKGNPHPHQNTFCVRKARFWDAGGYDESLCGFYGTDGYLIRRLMDRGLVAHLEDAPVVRYPREVIPDASTVDPEGGDPKAYRERSRRMNERGHVLSTRIPGAPWPVLAFPWEQVL